MKKDIDVRCSYARFFSEGHLSKEQFFEFGLKETIYAPVDKAKVEWENLKDRIQTDKTVFIRGFGRNGIGTHLFLDLYKKVFGNSNIKVDPANNIEPTKVIASLTGYSKTKSIQNYQVSHIFGRTKNIYAFTAPWNIVYTPKLLDPFTGHEAKGAIADEYRKLFLEQGLKNFSEFINEFNEIMLDIPFQNKLTESLSLLERENHSDRKAIEKFQKAVKDEFSPIQA